MRPTIELPTWSKKRVEFFCECGRIVTSMYKIGIKRSNCGECWKQKLCIGHTIRQLTLLEDVQSKLKSDKVQWKCNCGVVKYISIKSVINGLTSSCGCKQIRPNVGNCDSRDTNLISLQSIKGHKYHDLTIIDERDLFIHPGSEQKIKVACDCGNIKLVKLGSITRGYTKSCGLCNYTAYPAGYKFGSLAIKNNLYAGPHSEIQVECICNCGQLTTVRASHLIQGNTKTCGNCGLVMHHWWHNKPPISYASTKSITDKYNTHYLEQYFLGSMLKPLHSVSNLNQDIDFLCLYCTNKFTTKLSWIYNNRTKSCGCINHRISRLNHKISQLYNNSELEFRIKQYTFDVKIKDLLIECHGLYSHSIRSSRRVDLEKRQLAISHGYRYIMLYEDEINNIEKIRRYIDHLLNQQDNRIKLRPQSLTLTKVDGKIAARFYDDNHYLGSCSCRHHYAACLGQDIIAMMSFSHPSRQNVQGIELKRFSIDSRYKVYGLGTSMLNKVIALGDFCLPIISYSDNRLHDGRLYINMGFTKSHETKQDYYWVKNNKRYHKSALRKPKGSNVTESQLREAEGYRKIYDLGKTKWILS